MPAQVNAEIVNAWVHQDDVSHLHYTIRRANGGVRRLRTPMVSALAVVLLEYLDVELTNDPPPEGSDEQEKRH